LGHLTNTWLVDRDGAMLQRGMAEALANRPLIKHCYELPTPEVNDCLMHVATDLGYRHIILDRRAEDDRILSLQLAQATEAWGGPDANAIYAAIIAGTRTPEPITIQAAVAHMDYCLARRRDLLKLMHDYDQSPFVVLFEDVYADPEKGRALVRRLVEFVGMDPSDDRRYDDLVSDALLTRGQNSMQILNFVPNGPELHAILQEKLCHLPNTFVPS
jgi:hypothetical protein